MMLVQENAILKITSIVLKITKTNIEFNVENKDSKKMHK